MDQPTGEDVLHRLEPLVGTWDLEARAADGEAWPGGGRYVFEWHPSGAHLLQRGTVDHPDAPDSFSVIGCDGANGTYSQLYSDDRGVCRIYAMTLDDRTWTLERQGEPFAQRWTATFSDDGDTITGRWELAEDGSTYRTDFHLVLRRAT